MTKRIPIPPGRNRCTPFITAEGGQFVDTDQMVASGVITGPHRASWRKRVVKALRKMLFRGTKWTSTKQTNKN
jgi:hypothetical protein